MSVADPSESRRDIAASVAAFPGKPFAVVDGALFDDLPALFKKERLFARSLFLASADPETQKAGPFLVDLRQEPEVLDKILALVGDRPAVVFWSCDGGEMVIYRHLRTLAMARIPKWAADGLDNPGASSAPDDYEAVVFRHYDPRVLGSLLPTLDADQFARFLGPAEQVAFRLENGRRRRIVANPDWPAARPGLLTIRDDQVQAVIDTRIAASHRRIAAYLREVAPAHTSPLDEEALLQRVRDFEAEALALRAHREEAIGMWAYLRLTSRTDLSRDAKTVAFITEPDSSANDQIEALFERMTAGR